MLFWSVLGASIASALLPAHQHRGHPRGLHQPGAVARLGASSSRRPSARCSARSSGTGAACTSTAPPGSAGSWQKPKAKASLERWHERAEGRPWFTAALLFVSAATGFPPYAVTAVLAGTLRVPFWIFLVTGTLGRGLRFWAVVYGTSSVLDFL